MGNLSYQFFLHVVVDCGFTTLPNGQVSATSTIFGSVAVYSCAAGYNLDGPELRACQADGNWYGIQPTCRSE